MYKKLPSNLLLNADKLQDYLRFKNLHQKMMFHNDIPLSFHWADSIVLTKFLQQQMENEHHEIFAKLDKKLIDLKDVCVWIKNKGPVTNFTLYDVYMAVMGQLQTGKTSNNLQQKIEISFIGPAGPFKEVTPLELLNEQTYFEFIFQFLMRNLLPNREFRLLTQGKVIIKYAQQMSKSGVINVAQLTPKGILFSSKDNFLTEKILEGKEVCFLFNAHNLEILLDGGKDFYLGQELYFTHNESINFSINAQDMIMTKSFDGHLTGQNFIFCPYSKMHGNDISVLIKTLIDNIHSEVKSKVA